MLAIKAGTFYKVDETSAIPQHSLPVSIFWHLLPGVLLTSVYLVAGPLAQAAGYPPEVGLLIGVLLVLAPFALWHFKKVGQQEQVFFYRQTQPLKQYLIWVPLLLIWSFLMWGLAAPLDELVTHNLLGWLPSWFSGLTSDFSNYSRPALLLTLGLNLIINGLIAPVLEELYFRGYLLPRLSRFGWLAPLLNTILFSLYHFWQPMNYFKIGLAMFPWIYLTWRKQDFRLSLAVHASLNLLGALATLGMMLK